MNMRGRSRAWVLALAVAAAGLGVLPAASSAAPRRSQCATINQNVEDELGWVSYFTSLASAYQAAGNFDAARGANDWADTCQNLADNGVRLAAQLGC